MDIIVIPEGLSKNTDSGSGSNILSSYYAEVIEKIAREARKERRVFFAPGNAFGKTLREHEYAVTYLSKLRPDLKIISEKIPKGRRYFDTLDNAIHLRKKLIREKIWPLAECSLFCTTPHKFRSWLLFKICGYPVTKVYTARPKLIRNKIVPRLWYYDYAIIHFGYEILAIFYCLLKYLKIRYLKAEIERYTA